MAKVTVTYHVWSHARVPIPAELRPEIWFRPLGTSYAAVLMSSREVKGSLAADGSGSVALESMPGLLYMPVLRWLADPSQADEDIENRAYGYDEWTPFFPGTGGDIDELEPGVGLKGLLYGFGNPPEHLENVIYLDIKGPAIKVWGPPNSFVEV